MRFESGNVGVVNAQGKVILELGPFLRLEFAPNGFLKITDRIEFFVDMINGEIYAHMPKFVRFGDFEIASIGGFLCTRTKKLYEVKAIPPEAWLGKHGLYLKLSFRGEPEEKIKQKMIRSRSRYEVCLLNGDDSGAYWIIDSFNDHSLLVMDNQGYYYYARRNPKTRKAIKKHLGKVENEVNKVMMVHAIHEIEQQVSERIKKKAAQAQREIEKEHEKEIATLLSAEPFQIGNKWGLRKEGRIVVAPIYRMIKQSVGCYCAFEKNPRQWSVMAVDGQIEVEPRYEQVAIYPDGMVDLTVRPGKVTTMQLGVRNMISPAIK